MQKQNIAFLLFLLTSSLVMADSSSTTDSNQSDGSRARTQQEITDEITKAHEELTEGNIRPVKPGVHLQKGDVEFNFFGKFCPEFFYGANTWLLNGIEDWDQTFYVRQTLDLDVDTSYGKETYGFDAAKIKANIRSRARWGNPESISRTTDSTIKIASAKAGDHYHATPRNILWIRELWLQLMLSPIFGSAFDRQHLVKFGAFPFQLGGLPK